MSYLLRSDFYRLIRSKSLYICTLAALALSAINLYTIKWAANMSGDMGQVYASFLPKDGITYGLKAFADGNTQIIIGIITAIFVVAEFSHGTMKNVISKGFSRIQIYLSKLITMIVAVLILLFACFLLSTINATMISGTLGDFSWNSLKTLGIELLLNMAVTSIFVFVAMAIKNLGGVIAINILGILSFGPLIFTLLEYIFDGKITFTKYSLFNNISFYIQNSATGLDYLRSAIVAIVYLIVTTALGIYIFIKSDIK